MYVCMYVREQVDTLDMEYARKDVLYWRGSAGALAYGSQNTTFVFVSCLPIIPPSAVIADTTHRFVLQSIFLSKTTAR